MKLLLTAGPTREPIDAVRYIGNRSSGKMGLAIAQAAVERGHAVTAVLGPVALPLPPSVRRLDVETTEQMRQAVLAEWPSHDVLVMAAAVADYRVAQPAAGKLDRRTGPLVLELQPNPVIVAEAAARRREGQKVIGFALEADDALTRARRKLQEKGLDLIVVNPLGTMGASDVAATLLWADGREVALPPMDKSAFARRLIREAEVLFAGPAGGEVRGALEG
ncbi:MAG: phosphopantothenoylcysteine decarboxylase [Tepidisphaerales bacterium]